MKKPCAYCNLPIVGKQKTAKYCSDICRLRAFRSRNKALKRGYAELHPRKEETALNHLKNDAPQSVKSFTCCENGRFYSPTGRWGEILICDSCGSVWKRLDKDPRIKDQDNQEPKEND